VTVDPSQATAPSTTIVTPPNTKTASPTATTNTPEIITTPPTTVDTASLTENEDLEIPREQVLPTPHPREWFVAQAAATAAANAVTASAVTTAATAANAVNEEGEAHETDPDADLFEENFDPNELARDLAEEDHDGRHRARWNQYLQDKPALIGTTVKPSNKMVWTVREDVAKSEVPDNDREQKEVGVKNFDFNNKTISTPDGSKRVDLLELLIHLWPCDWMEQLHELNTRIVKNNDDKRANRRNSAWRDVNEISEHEFWTFFGIMLVARLEG
jgi:hypothetical protein